MRKRLRFVVKQCAAVDSRRELDANDVARPILQVTNVEFPALPPSTNSMQLSREGQTVINRCRSSRLLASRCQFAHPAPAVLGYLDVDDLRGFGDQIWHPCHGRPEVFRVDVSLARFG